jgi:PAP2 superfamily
MEQWIAASVAFFLYVAILALALPRLTRRARLLAAAGAGAGLLICAVARLQPASEVLSRWILPPTLLLLGYWTSGLLFTAPMPAAERLLEAADAALNVDKCAAAVPRWLAELFEAAYVGIYPLIPLALFIHLATSAEPDGNRFWTVILVTDYVCFAALPWVQTRPPRAVRTADPWIARMRSFNLKLLGKSSIQVNTFPSGHAAEGLAAALLVLDAPWPLAAYVAVAAVLVSAGAVLGRYHYAADAIAGWFVAAGVWWIVG